MNTTAEEQLAGFMAKYTPEVEAQGWAALEKMRGILPPAIEMVYDNYNFLVIGFCPTERPSEAILSLALAPKRVNLCFLQSQHVEDPAGLLVGSGSVARHVPLDGGAADLDKPEIRALIGSALSCAKVPFGDLKEPRLVIKSISAKQRPRRPSE